MRTRRTGLFGAAVCSIVIGISGAAWACVPGHDHTGANDTDHAAHAAAQAPAAPVITVAPVAEEPTAAPQQQATTGATAAPSTPAGAAAPAPAATRTTTAPARTATAPAGTPAAPAPAVATPGPAASVTPAPAAVAPDTPVTTAWQPRVVTEVPASQESSGSGSSVGGVLLAGFGVAVLVLGVVFAALRWRRDVAPPAILPD